MKKERLKKRRPAAAPCCRRLYFSGEYRRGRPRTHWRQSPTSTGKPQQNEKCTPATGARQAAASSASPAPSTGFFFPLSIASSASLASDNNNNNKTNNSRTMARRAVATTVKDLASLRSEVTSVGASIVGMTRDGHLAQISLTVLYRHRGRPAVGLTYEDLLAREFFETAPVAVPAERAPAADDHTWWPQRTRLCAAMAPVCAIVGLDTLGSFNLTDLSRPKEGALVAYRAHRRAGTAMGRYGVVPVAVLAGTSEDGGLGDVPWLYSEPPLCLDRLEGRDAGVERAHFHRTTLARDAALKVALIEDHDPYSPEGVEAMTAVLRRIQDVYARHDHTAMADSIDDLAHQLTASPYLHHA
ncbi:hypothetical protein [Pandoravirus japonicus]|uniref:Uncharacterized protein n=1 Tax=Pandoravirus japonicus TaxID=2823154 RepID=A0A811BNV0_9VIRU|nr:hypothetical protein [Pandoravirus japonicus]